MKKTHVLTALALLSLAACDPPRNRTDAGTPPIDALVIRDDASVEPGADASIDAAMVVMPDAFVPPMFDAAMPDAFAATPDAFTPTDAFAARDAAFATTPCEQIAAVRATNGALAPAYPVRGAVVSYVMPVLPVGATDCAEAQAAIRPCGHCRQVPGARLSQGGRKAGRVPARRRL